MRTAVDEIILGIEQAKGHLAYWAHMDSVKDKLPEFWHQRIPQMQKMHQRFLAEGEAKLAASRASQAQAAMEEDCDLA